MDLRSKAIASLVCGIIAVLTIFTGWGVLLGLALGIAGIVLSVNIKKELENMGDVNSDPSLKEIKNMATGGLICSIVGTVIAGIGFLCVACIVGTAGASMGFAACAG